MFSLTSLRRRGRTAPGDTIQGAWHPSEVKFFAVEFTKNTGQTTLDGGEGESGDNNS